MHDEIFDHARADRLRASLWAMLNGSAEDARAASDDATAGGAPGYFALGFSFRTTSRLIRDQMTDELLSSSQLADKRA